MLKVLLIIEQCNPEWASVPLVGYKYYRGINELADTTLVTHGRNKEALERKHPEKDIYYISESKFIGNYYKIANQLSRFKGRTIWPIYHTLTYPIYAVFDYLVCERFKSSVLRGDYDILHVITPMMPRYPVKLISACSNTPFILGPVNGGVPYPNGFRKVARKEAADLNFLRLIGRWIIPGYRKTYKKADYILVGSTYTLNLIKNLFSIDRNRIQLFYENGIENSFLGKAEKDNRLKSDEHNHINLLFVGRLVPYKGADMLLEAISILKPSIQDKIFLTIVGDGSERGFLEHQIDQLNLEGKVEITGWIPQEETLKYYRDSDIFCFPSIREFGGAVVLEAMANGLPCIVVNNGGIGEYVTNETGFRVEPVSRHFVIEEFKKCIEKLVAEQALLQEMSSNSLKRAKAFTWSTKSKQILALYQNLLNKCETE